MASIPGVCSLTRFGSTIGEVLGYDGESFDPDRVEILRLEVLARFEYLLEGSYHCDPIKVFIKQEPHKVSKLKEGRLRLISAVSVIDTMVDRMLFQRIFKKVVSEPLSTPVAIGWSPVQSGAAYLRMHLSGKTFDTDKKHWDWTFPWWLLVDSYKVLLQIASPAPWWEAVALRRFKCLFKYARFSFPDGQVVDQREKGIMKSGCYLTLLMNSLGQWILHEHAQLSLGVNVKFICFGDDGTQEHSEHDDKFVAFYEKLGFKVEHGVHDNIEFCGFHIFANSKFLPAYKDKHVFMLRHLTLDPTIAVQTLQSYQYLYWFDRAFLDFVRSIAKSRGLHEAIIPDDQICRVVYGR